MLVSRPPYLRFTLEELELINRMMAVATAASWGEGDYQSWKETDVEPFNALRTKVHETMRRRVKRKMKVMASEPRKVFRHGLPGTKTFNADTGKELKPGDEFTRAWVEFVEPPDPEDPK